MTMAVCESVPVGWKEVAADLSILKITESGPFSIPQTLTSPITASLLLNPMDMTESGLGRGFKTVIITED